MPTKKQDNKTFVLGGAGSLREVSFEIPAGDETRELTCVVDTQNEKALSAIDAFEKDIKALMERSGSQDDFTIEELHRLTEEGLAVVKGFIGEKNAEELLGRFASNYVIILQLVLYLSSTTSHAIDEDALNQAIVEATSTAGA